MKPVYTLDDLTDRATLDHGASQPALLAVLGYPIQHSASPQMHQAALDALGIDSRYIRLEVEPGSIAQAFERMRQLGFIGCNVTVPHKLEAMRACDSLTPAARNLGVANTIHFTSDKIIGHNTDGPGLIKALETDLGFRPQDARVLLLGAGGGAGKAIATQLAVEGVAELHLSNRTLSKVQELKRQLAPQTSATIHILSNSQADLEAISDKVDLIINATSIGLKSGDPSPFPIELFGRQHLVYDAIYNPAETRFLAAAKAAGAKTSNGLSMLVHQGALAFEMWMNTAPDIRLMDAAVR